MSGIRGRNTKPEMELRRALHKRGFRFRVHARELPGRPDIVLPRHRAAIMVHGCFWHRHEGCRFATNPATRTEFWQDKFEANVARDRRNEVALVAAGWRVAIVWECALRGASTASTVQQTADWLLSDGPSIMIGGASP